LLHSNIFCKINSAFTVGEIWFEVYQRVFVRSGPLPHSVGVFSDHPLSLEAVLGVQTFYSSQDLFAFVVSVLNLNFESSPVSLLLYLLWKLVCRKLKR